MVSGLPIARDGKGQADRPWHVLERGMPDLQNPAADRVIVMPPAEKKVA